MIGYKEFEKVIKNELEETLGSEYHISVQEVIKINGLVLNGITFTKENQNISPTIYLENYFDSYQEGKPMENIVKEILECYENHKFNNQMDMDFFVDFSKVKSRIVFKIINTEKNQQLLEDVPHILVLDLAIVFYYLLDNTDFGAATILIHNNHLTMWNITTDELYEIAKINSPMLLRTTFVAMEDIMMEMLTSEEITDGDTEMEDIVSSISNGEEMDMFVLSNQLKLNGAAVLFYPGILEKVSDKFNSDLYILPSSIHEAIILKADFKKDRKDLDSMIEEINKTQVEPQEVLSNHSYFYSREKMELVI